MTVREIIESGKMRIIKSPPFNERRFAIHDKHHHEAIAYIEDGAEIPTELADKTVWLGYHDDSPEEHTCVLCLR